ncbi:PAT complex subunit CCDC47 [Phlebotomus argentipes]|uniref:PAT complex subunit CCDC47 n=1 Tax=Phlebotomus argentipes TaxID=94469 RepID=UPI0028931A1A|nr:PAT complex subunit CCDC47 [Phlebotomus argentipes]
MRIAALLLIVALVGDATWAQQAGDFEDNDFAEFEDFDDDFVTVSPGAPAAGQASQKKEPEPVNGDFKEIDADDGDEAVVEDEESEFEHFHDEEEFEGFPGGEAPPSEGASLDPKAGEPKLTMAKVPMHFRTHWDSYWMEMIMIAGLLAYFSNFFMGKSKNTKLANLWLSTHRSLLEENFVLVGDDGKLENESHGLIKESESTFTLWCSGRTCCEGMLVELKMIKRQDLVAIIAGLLRPNQDQVHVKIEMSRDVMDTFVFCVATKKTATKMFKEQSDLSKFCTLVNKSEDKYKVPLGFCVLSELPEASSGVLDSRLIAALNKYAPLIEYIHVSDQFCGVVQQEDPANLKQPEVKRMLMAGFNLPPNIDMETAKPLLVLVFYLMERLKRFRLSKESKAKADKNRARVEEQFLKNTHAARAEAAAQRREEKRKAEKERVMAEDDPEKQRRWEKKEQKRQAKKKAPKMKQLSIKAL